MLVSVAGNSILVSPEALNASAPIAVQLARVTFVNELVFLNVESGIVFQ